VIKFYSLNKIFCLKIVLFFFLISICAWSCKTNLDKDKKNVFRYNESQGIPTLDPAFARNQVIMWPVNQLFNGLLQMNDTLGIEPCIAKKWMVSNDGLIYTFVLREDVYFHDHEVFENGKGRKVRASDFEYSFNRILDKKTASPGAWIFNMVDTSNGKPFNALNDSIFEIHLKTPFPAFLGILTMNYCSVVPHEMVSCYGEDFGRNPVGTGPFIFKYWKDGEKLIMLKNESYFENDEEGNKLPYLDAIAISFIKDKQSEFLEFVKGNIDFLSGIHTSYKNELITISGRLNPKYEGKVLMLKEPYLNTEYLGVLHEDSAMVLKDSPLRYKKIRKAINYGFDRDRMMKFMRNSIGSPAHSGFIPKGLSGYSEGWGYHYDPAKARQLVEEVKNRVGELYEITLTTTSDYLDLCEFIQHELAKIGLKINIEVSVGATFRSSVANSKLEFFRGSWIADYPDAENYMALFYSKNLSPSGPNYTHFSNGEFDRLYEKSFYIRDTEKRLEFYHQMDCIVMEEAAIVPLYYDEVVRFIQTNIEGLSTNPVNQLVLKKVRRIN